MDYMIKLRKETFGETNLPYFEPVLAYVKDEPDLRGLPENQLENAVKTILKNIGVDDIRLKPEKWDLDKTEEVVVIPNYKVETKKRRNSKTIFHDDITLPRHVLKTWKQYKNNHYEVV